MIALVGFGLVALFGLIFLMAAIMPMLADHETDRIARRAEIVSLDHRSVRRPETIDRADAA